MPELLGGAREQESGMMHTSCHTQPPVRTFIVSLVAAKFVLALALAYTWLPAHRHVCRFCRTCNRISDLKKSPSLLDSSLFAKETLEQQLVTRPMSALQDKTTVRAPPPSPCSPWPHTSIGGGAGRHYSAPCFKDGSILQDAYVRLVQHTHVHQLGLQ